MQPLSLTTEPRVAHGSGACRKLRRDGRVPSVVYGLGSETVSITVDERAFHDIVKERGPSAIVSLQGPAGVQPAMIQAIQRHPVSLRPLAIDFIRVDLSKPITVEVPVTLVGALEDLGPQDVIQQLMHVAYIEALPTEVPSEITVDISSLTPHAPILADALVLPEGATLLVDPHEPVVTLSSASPLEVEQPEGEEGEEGEPPAEGETSEE